MNKRFEELDALRGLAALSVLLSHFIATFPNLAWWFAPFNTSPFHIIWAGHQAVIFFFVLSGFVLSLSFLDGKISPPYSVYAAKRFLRIYPPYICAAAAALLLRQLLYAGPVPSLGESFNSVWTNPVTWAVIRGHLLLIGQFSSGDFNPVVWSLTHEMRISLIFPILIYLVVRREMLSIALAALTTSLSLVLYFAISKHFIHQVPILRTTQYIGTFIVGALLAKHRSHLILCYSRLPPKHSVEPLPCRYFSLHLP